MSATRRTLLTGATGLAAAVATSSASLAQAIAATNPDAELLALRPAWEITWTAFRGALKDLNAAEISKDPKRLTRAREVEAITSAANTAVTDQIAATPARTLTGLRFKAEASVAEDHNHEDLVRSIMEDIAATSVRPLLGSTHR